MGSGIAQCFAAAGSTVVVVESDQETAAAALDRIRTGLGHAAERGLLVGGDDEAHLQRFHELGFLGVRGGPARDSLSVFRVVTDLVTPVRLR